MMLGSVARVYGFYFKLGKKTRKTKLFYLVSLFPVVIALAIKIGQITSGKGAGDGMAIFSNLILVFYLQFLILILALFYGTSICSEELEAKTLNYLTTRPVSKSAIILGKYAAYSFLLILMISVSVILSFLVLNLGRWLDFSLYKILLRDAAVLALGLVCYTAFFTFSGTFLRRAIIFGLVFSFGWENVIQYFPGSTQRLALIHYLKSLLPQASDEKFSFLLFRLEPTPPGLSVLSLFLISGVFLGLACLVFSQKEYLFED